MQPQADKLHLKMKERYLLNFWMYEDLKVFVLKLEQKKKSFFLTEKWNKSNCLHTESPSVNISVQRKKINDCSQTSNDLLNQEEMDAKIWRLVFDDFQRTFLKHFPIICMSRRVLEEPNLC